jgi:hypothetical protein
MMLSIESLKQSGSFVGQPVKQEIIWHVDGKELKNEVYVRRASYTTVTQEWKAAHETKDAIAGRIAGYICDADGKAIFTVDDILGKAEEGRGELCAQLTIALFVAINEVNNPKPEEKKPSTTSGSTSSSPGSEEKPLRKPSKT